MRKHTGRVIRVSATALGVAALGMTFAGTASAEELGGGLLGGSNGSDGDRDGYTDEYSYDNSSESNGVADAAGVGGVTDAAGVEGVGGVGGLAPVDTLETFQLPVSMRTAGLDQVELPGVSLLGFDDAENNGLPSLGQGDGSGITTGLETPGLTGLKILPFGG